MENEKSLPPGWEQDLDELARAVAGLGTGGISAAELRAIRVPQGVYEERRAGSFMLRVRLAAGLVTHPQLRALARVAGRYGSDTLHLTTRQDIQIHRVALPDVHPALVELARAGLSTKGGGGNTVRNITACSHAGVCPRESFDVSPWAVGLTRELAADPGSFRLPRKFKIALSGCPDDCAGAVVNDLGFVAREENGRSGFAVYVGGGLGARSRVGDLLEEFVPAERAHVVAEAVKRVFDRRGNRRNRSRARLRFLVEQLGVGAFRHLYEVELAALEEEQPAPLQSIEADTRPEVAAGSERPASGGAEPECERWLRDNVENQKHAGRYLVHLPVLLGDITRETLAGLAEVIESHGLSAARVTQQQNFVLRDVAGDELLLLHGQLRALGLAQVPAQPLRNLVSCAGAATCKLGICLSRGLARALTAELELTLPGLTELAGLRIQVSGCPNACGRHPLADIGLFGAARRADGRLVPHYVVQLGGRTGEGRARLAEGNAAVPARRVPLVVAGLLTAFRASPAYPDFQAYIADEGHEELQGLAAANREMPPFAADPTGYFDWGADEPFSLAGRGPGECGAGVFDLIEIDLAGAGEALGAGRLFRATALACRALLVTQGLEADGELEALRRFRQHFLASGLVPAELAPLLERAISAAAGGSPDLEEIFGLGNGADCLQEAVAGLLHIVRGLYASMDDSLRFPALPVAGTGLETPAPAGAVQAAADREVDFRGVVCPLNYVKTKMLLERMATGEVLAVLLDEAGARNVPESTAKDGHEVLAVVEDTGHWRVLLRRGA